MMDVFYSVIVPVYRVEPFIGRCIESVIFQTFRNLELILVDDGSPDKSGKICDQYAKTDFRIKVIHTSNGGVSQARNVGISHALGKWLIFLDADDALFDSKVLEKMYGEIVSQQADIYQFQIVHIVHTGNGCQKWITAIKPGFYYIGGKEYKNLKPKRGQASNYVFNRELVKKKCIYFPEGVRISEDQAFTYSYLVYCDTMRICDLPLYVYHVNENPYNSSSVCVGKNLFQDAIDHIEAIRQVIVHSINCGKNRGFINERVAMMILYLITVSECLSHKDRVKIHSYFVKNISFNWRYLFNNKAIFVLAIYQNLDLAIHLMHIYRYIRNSIQNLNSMRAS